MHSEVRATAAQQKAPAVRQGLWSLQKARKGNLPSTEVWAYAARGVISSITSANSALVVTRS